MTATAVTLTNLGKSFGDLTAVADLSLHLAAGSFTALLGPSGCGKSTTLSMLAGLTAPDTGEMHFGGRSILGVPAERRPVGLVFQKPLLFPHLDVEANVGFGLRMRRTGGDETRRRVREMLALVQLDGLGARRVGELSGGQEQRVALARALVLQPSVLLLDEPFSQLDAGLRSEMRGLVRDLHRQTGMTTLFVTHDQAEAVEVADSVALMLEGRLEGHASAQVFFTDPPSPAAARFFGAVNELAGDVRDGCFHGAGGVLGGAPATDGPYLLVIRPESLELVTGEGPETLAGTAISLRFAGSHQLLEVRLPSGEVLTVQLAVGAVVTLGTRVVVRVPPDRSTYFPCGPR